MLLMRYFWRFMHVVGFQNPASPAKNLYKRTKIEVKYRKWIEKYQKIIICGHTHRPKFSESDQLPYFNTGCCIHTKGITGIEIADGSIMASIREIFGNGTWFGLEIPVLISHKISILTLAPGGFFIYGILIAIMNRITNGKASRNAEKGCAGCAGCAGCGASDDGCTAKGGEA